MCKTLAAILLFGICAWAQPCTAQHIFYQDVFNGGVTGGGGSTGAGSGTFYFDVHIEPGSTIRKAFLIAGVDGQPEDVTITLNGTEYTFNSNSIVTTDFISTYTSPPPSSVNCIDITNDINPAISEYSLYVPPQQPITQQLYGPFYLLIAFENSSLSETGVNVVLNNMDVDPEINYSISNLFPFDTSKDVGFSFVGGHFCDSPNDGSYIFINGNNIGLAHGSGGNSNWSCTGVQGHFYYLGSLLFGLNDNTPTNIY